MPGLRGCTGFSLAVAHRLPITGASLTVVHGLQAAPATVAVTRGAAVMVQGAVVGLQGPRAQAQYL